MRVRKVGEREDRAALEMTPMIDIVFQLLVFFIMTFKIVLPEGDFNIRMPLAASQGIPEETLPPIKIELKSNREGELISVKMGDRIMNPEAKFQSLHNHVISFMGEKRGSTNIIEAAEVEIDADYNLKYKYIIDTITAVSGYVTPDGDTVKLVEKIKFSPPREPK